jgi:hypothetical protein
VARAKRFDRTRAEARRRYRASQTSIDGSTPEGDEAAATAHASDAAAPVASRRVLRGDASKATTRSAAQQPQGRMGLSQAFRAAFRQPNLSEDVAALPRLLIDKSVWIPIGLALATVVLLVAVGPLSLVLFAFQTFILPPSLAPIFITGFFAPRASYLLAGIVSVVCSVLYSLTFVLVQQRLIPGWPEGAVLPIGIAEAFALGPAAGVVFGAMAAWYRRFLYLTGPARTPAKGQGANRRAAANRPAARRR